MTVKFSNRISSKSFLVEVNSQASFGRGHRWKEHIRVDPKTNLRDVVANYRFHLLTMDYNVWESYTVKDK